MKAFIIYQAEVAVCLALFYTFYHFFLRNETQFLFKRVYFLVGIIISFMIPTIQIGLSSSTPIPTILPADYFNLATSSISYIPVASEPQTWDVWKIIFLIWLIGLAFFLVRLGISFIKVREILNQTTVTPDNNRIRTINTEVQSFSFFQYVVINQKHFDSVAKQFVIDHEFAHSSQFHSIDILLIELVKCVQWFNPIVWILGNRIIMNLEFLADQTVLNKYQNLSDYQLSLVQFAHSASYKPLKMEFSKLHLKQRLKMMDATRKNVHPIKWAGLFVLILLMGFTLSVKGNQEEITHQVAQSINHLIEPIPLQISNHFIQEIEREIISESKKNIITVNGKVLSDQGPIVGASIISGEHNIGTITDVNGDFVINIPKSTELTITFPGYVTAQVKVDPNSEIMNVGVILLSEDKENSTGINNPMYVIDGEVFDHETGEIKFKKLNPDLIDKISINPGNPELIEKYGEKAKGGVMLISLKDKKDKASDKDLKFGNLYIRHDEASPDTTYSIKLGSLHIKGKDLPLYIIDGVEYEGEEGMREMEKLGIKSIKSISVLKDQSSTEVYGKKGKNGVLIIELKEKLSSNVTIAGSTNLWGKPQKGIQILYDKNKLKPIFIINNREYNHEDGLHELQFISTTEVEVAHLFEDKAAIERYGPKGTNGVIVIVTNNSQF
ncbi:MAG: M56 family metallopeptidase [Bacteroidota bacterium]